MTKREIQRTGADTFRLELHPKIRRLLADLKDMTLSHIEEGSPASRRIYPIAYQGSPEMEMDFEQLTRKPLAHHHRENLDLFGDSISKSVLSEAEALAWIGALNDMRLVLGTALDITEDQPLVDPSDPNYEGHVIYDLLTFLQGMFIEEIQNMK